MNENETVVAGRVAERVAESVASESQSISIKKEEEIYVGFCPEEHCPKPASPSPDLTVKTSSKAVKPKGYPDDFETFWRAYPTDPGMSKQQARAAWRKLSGDERGAAIASMPGFIAWCKRQGHDYRTLHAVRFLTQKRFEGFTASMADKANDADWNGRLEIARRRKEWDVTKWGPMPGASGCIVPQALLLPDDGRDWKAWRAAA